MHENPQLQPRPLFMRFINECDKKTSLQKLTKQWKVDEIKRMSSVWPLRESRCFDGQSTGTLSRGGKGGTTLPWGKLYILCGKKLKNPQGSQDQQADMLIAPFSLNFSIQKPWGSQMHCMSLIGCTRSSFKRTESKQTNTYASYEKGGSRGEVQDRKAVADPWRLRLTCLGNFHLLRRG